MGYFARFLLVKLPFLVIFLHIADVFTWVYYEKNEKSQRMGFCRWKKKINSIWRVFFFRYFLEYLHIRTANFFYIFVTAVFSRTF
jgi:hypothetical protein